MHLLPPTWLIRIAVAAVWLYEGLWCKILGREARQLEVVQAAPLGKGLGGPFLKALGVVEIGVGLWVLTGSAGLACAITQTALLAALNTSGILWARKIIHDPAGMVVKNFAFLILAWVAASLPPWGWT